MRSVCLYAYQPVCQLEANYGQMDKQLVRVDILIWGCNHSNNGTLEQCCRFIYFLAMLNSQLIASNNAPYIPANIFTDKNIKNEKLFEMINKSKIYFQCLGLPQYCILTTNEFFWEIVLMLIFVWVMLSKD